MKGLWNTDGGEVMIWQKDPDCARLEEGRMLLPTRSPPLLAEETPRPHFQVLLCHHGTSLSPHTSSVKGC